MVRFEQHTLKTLGEERWKELFTNAFGGFDPAVLPHTVLLVYDGDRLVGFQSIRVCDKRSVSIALTGFVPDIERNKKYPYFRASLRHLHGLGFKFIRGTIHNGNVLALIWALKSGFKVVGTRQAYTGELFVEVLRCLDVGDTVVP